MNLPLARTLPIPVPHSLPTLSQCLMHRHCVLPHHLEGHNQQMSIKTHQLAPSSKAAFSPLGWRLQRQGLAVGVFARGGETYVLQGHNYDTG